MSLLRARCPDCRTLTAVALDEGYECHSCGRSFSAGLVRVPRAWGDGGEAMVEAASLPLPYPEAAVIEADTLPELSHADGRRSRRGLRVPQLRPLLRRRARARASRVG